MELVKIGAQVFGSTAACALAAPYFGGTRADGVAIGIITDLGMQLQKCSQEEW